MDKKSLSERDICTKFITPAIVNSGWDIQKQLLEEISFADSRNPMTTTNIEKIAE